jgi:GNAT superfamily N-acetyltransferase
VVNCSLREVTFSDLAALIREAVRSGAFLPLKGDAEPFLLSMPRLLEGHPDYHLFVLEANEGREVGFVVTLPHKEAGTVSIGPLYVRERYRGRGWGGQMVACLVAWAGSRGITALFAQTWGKNAASRRILEGLGFRCVGEAADTRVDGDSTIKYRLQIEGRQPLPGNDVVSYGGSDES